MSATCVRCERPMADQAYACATCANRAAEQLRLICDMLPAARDVAHGLSRRGGSGNASGKPGSQIPIDLTAMAKLDAVQNELTTWTRHIAEVRGGDLYPLDEQDPIVIAAVALKVQLEWMRHRAEVDEFLTDVDACARVVAGIARGPAPQKYLGPCGAERWPTEYDSDVRCPVDGEMVNRRCWNCGWERREEFQPCDGDIYAREGASVGRCRTCGAEVASEDRRAWLDAEVRSHAFRAAEIANAYGINVKTIRSWATDRQARYDHSGTCVQAARPAKLHPHGWDRDQRPLFLVGDVLDLAAQEAARREEARAERARRAAARETAEMGA